MPFFLPPALRGLCLRWAVLAGGLSFFLLSAGAAPENSDPQDFDLPAGPASQTLKIFSEQSGRGVIVANDVVRDVQTVTVQGKLTAHEALRRMLAGTVLEAIEDEKELAFTVRRKRPADSAPDEPDAPKPKDAAPVVSAPRASGARADDAVVTLNPFEVREGSDQSYGALNSNSITRFDVELDKTPLSADIFTSAFMKDTQSLSVEDMVQAYSAGAGFTTSDPGSAAATVQPLDRNGNAGTTLRGLSNTQEERDGFLPVSNSTGVGFTSTFDVERVEIINGPQALLYGTGGGGGVINIVSKQARLDSPTRGNMQFSVNQYGDRRGEFDVGAGNASVAARVAVIDQTVGGRRFDIGGPMNGYYTQIAARLFGNTLIRATVEQTTYDRINSTNISLTASSTSNDARNKDSLHYLLATNQVDAAAGGAPSGAGPINGGNLNWGNVDSLGGWWNSEQTINEVMELTAETEWSSWLSSQLTLGYDNHISDRMNNSLTYVAPNSSTNPLTGQWAMGMNGTFPAIDTNEPVRTKAIRFSLVATNDLFGGKAHSQTVLGTDYSGLRSAQVQYSYFAADSNFNPILTSAGVRTALPKLWWPSQGAMQYPFFTPSTPHVNVAGQNYVRVMINPVSPALISAADPLGVTPGGSTYLLTTTDAAGVFGANMTQWMNGKLETLAGFRLGRSYDLTQAQGAAAPAPENATQISTLRAVSYNVGVNYALLDWLRPYVSVSDSYDPPSTELQNPYGASPLTAHAVGEEAGVKVQNSDRTISGSIALYRANSKNEQYAIQSALENDINPTGLNGRFMAPSNYINVDRTSEGIQAALTAAPNSDLRLRLSAAVVNGKIGNSTVYGQLYNDQFNANAQGQVTYADGAVVYVPPTYNSKATLAYTAANAPAGAVPLTIAALSSPASVYYANPANITGQISSSAAVASVLKVVDPTHGAILTGQTGLPISQLQIIPSQSGITIPGSIVTSAAGEATTGYPELSVNLTGLYTIPKGVLRGLQLGGTLLGGWYNRSYYYYPAGVGPGSARILFDNPTLAQFNLIVGYRRKFGRFAFRSQVNVSNLFNHYDIILLPNEVTGWTSASGLNATFWQQPRAWSWSNTLEL